LGNVALAHRIAVGFGVLTTDDQAQALARAGGAAGNKGYEAAEAALQTADVSPGSPVQRPRLKRGRARSRSSMRGSCRANRRSRRCRRVARMHGGMPEGFDRGADLAARAVAGRPEFDRQITAAAEHWRFERVGVVERNILRLALAELDEGATPARVVVDEASSWRIGSRAPKRRRS